MFLKNNLFPAAIWLGICLFFREPSLTPISLLFLFRNLIIFGCLLTRHSATFRSPIYQRLIAWGSALLPMLMQAEIHSNLFDLSGLTLSICGTLIVGLSCIDLGRSFGVSPALRPYVQSGIYRYIKHPMYLGHLLMELGIIIAEPSTRNIAILILSWLLYRLRISLEARLISTLH